MKILVTGSAGYVASKLIPALTSAGHEVVGLDIRDGRDIRDMGAVRQALYGCDAVIHLACLSNDPSADLDRNLTRSINLDSFPPLLGLAGEAGVKRFIFASSSSVYGVKEEMDVTEDLALEPLTDYSIYKARCEDMLLAAEGMERVIIRPATVCGYAPSMRLDLLVHILTLAALRDSKITVHGGWQYRPNIHIDDMVSAYIALLDAPKEFVDGEVFNCGTQNMTILETAKLVREVIGPHVEIDVIESRDPRSYHVNSDKIKETLDWLPEYTVRQAIQEVAEALEDGRIPDPDDSKYYRVRGMKELLTK